MLSAHTIVDWLDRTAAQFPERPAIEDSAGRSMCYRQFIDLARRVQSLLMGLGVRPNDRVGVCMKKSIDTAVAFQGILRSGAAYVPTDPLAPASRTAFMLNDCEASAVFVDETLADGLRSELEHLGCRLPLIVVPTTPTETQTWRIEAVTSGDPAEPVTGCARDVAFMLYTSGSTGRPKAVMLTNENVVSFVDWCSTRFTPTEHDKFATHAPLHFSLSVFNLYVAWKHGGTVVLIDEQTAKVPQLIAPLIYERGVSVWFSTPSILSLLAQSGALSSITLPSLRLVIFAGEPFSGANLRHLMSQLPHPRYVHSLGSSETHIMTHYEVPSLTAANGAPIPIGKVCEHFRSRIVDDDGHDVPPGGEGELYLSGPGVALGYWKAPDASSQRFFVDEHGDTWYRTGDIVSIRPDGDLVYRGRRDRMIKRRGNRVELGEIEACLSGNARIREVAVVAVADQDMQMTVHAFVVPRDGQRPTVLELKSHCARSLPVYMVPDAFVFRDVLPRTSNGKIDFPALKTAV